MRSTRITRSLTHFALAVALSALAVAPLAAQPYTVDFQGEATGPVAGGSLAYTFGGLTITFSGLGLTVADLSPSYPLADRVLRSFGFTAPITLTFTGNTVGSVTVRNHIHGQGLAAEVDVLRLRAYDASNTQIGDYTSSGFGEEFITLAVPGIARLTVDDVGSGFTIDDVTVDDLGATTTAPEPASLALLASGLVGVVGVGLRRRRLA